MTTAAEINVALTKHYAPPAWRTFFEVGNDTGSRVKRHIDLLACGIWPSVGHAVHGVEVKVSKGDWKRELADPAKSQELMRYCNRWWLACPDGLVHPDEVPETWGVLTVADGRVKVKKQAPALHPEPFTAGFVMAVLRQAGHAPIEVIEAKVKEHIAEREKRIEREIESGIAHRVQDNAARLKWAQELEGTVKSLTGESPRDWSFDPGAFAAAYRLLKTSGIGSRHRTYEGLPHVLDELNRASASLRKLIESPDLAALRATPSPKTAGGGE